jgi:hypothetical protein
MFKPTKIQNSIMTLSKGVVLKTKVPKLKSSKIEHFHRRNILIHQSTKENLPSVRIMCVAARRARRVSDWLEHGY